VRRRARAALVALLAGASGILSPVARGADEKPRPTQPAVEVIEAKDKEIKIQEVRDLITRRLHVEETAGEPVDLLKGSVRLFGPDGARIEAGCKIAGKECQNGASLSALGSAPIELVAKLPRLGVYTGSLTLVWSKKKQWYSIELTRALAPPGIDVIVPAAIAGEGGSAQIQLKLRETSGRTLEKLVPRLEACARRTTRLRSTQPARRPRSMP